jgi:hypothetical protein
MKVRGNRLIPHIDRGRRHRLLSRYVNINANRGVATANAALR